MGNYGRDLKNYDKALRSRNLLLREGRPRREIEAYDIPLADAGDRITGSRRDLVAALEPLLLDEKCSHIARLALEPMPCPEAGKALRDALGKLDKTAIALKAGIIGSLAIRKKALYFANFSSLVSICLSYFNTTLLSLRIFELSEIICFL